MSTRARNVLIAEMSPEAAERLSGMLGARGWKQVGCVRSGRAAVEAATRLLPDLVILDEVLPELDGLSAAEALLARPLGVRPGIVLTRLARMRTTRVERLEEAGCAVLMKPVCEAGLDRAIEAVALPARRVPADVRARLKALLDRLGLPARSGRDYLEAAILCAWQDARLTGRLTRELYPLVGELFGADGKKVERDMRRAIEYAWKFGAIEEQYTIFGGTIDAQRGKPTCGEMIAQLADILRLEGR